MNLCNWDIQGCNRVFAALTPHLPHRIHSHNSSASASKSTEAPFDVWKFAQKRSQTAVPPPPTESHWCHGYFWSCFFSHTPCFSGIRWGDRGDLHMWSFYAKFEDIQTMQQRTFEARSIGKVTRNQCNKIGEMRVFAAAAVQCNDVVFAQDEWCLTVKKKFERENAKKHTRKRYNFDLTFSLSNCESFPGASQRQISIRTPQITRDTTILLATFTYLLATHTLIQYTCSSHFHHDLHD